MRQFTVSPPYNQTRTDRFLFDMLPNINASIIFKAFRKRSIKVNDKRVKEFFLLTTGDKVEVYIPDEYLNEPACPDSSEDLPHILYEDDNILIITKPQGIPVHQDKNIEAIVLDRWVQKFIRKRDSGNSFEDAFPALCHRIDRNTGGLVVFAKDCETLAIMEDKFRKHEVRKTYRCLVYGVPEKPSQELTGYLKKDHVKSRVFIYDDPIKGSEHIITRYRTLKTIDQFSLLEVELITGKTHQIRAHLAYNGYPLLGDGKYGINSVNRKLKLKWQALWAIRLSFDFSEPSGHLSYLAGKQVTLPFIPWEEGLSRLGFSDSFSDGGTIELKD